MSHLLGYHVFFGILLALGLWLLLSGLRGWRRPEEPPASLKGGLPRAGQGLAVVSDLPPLAQRVLAAPLTDLGLALRGRRDPGPLEDRLRRSGWRYQSAGDYYGSQMAMMILLFVLGVVLGVALRFPPLGIAAAGAALGAVGLYFPENNVRETIKTRREAVYREMAWTLDRVAAVLKTGLALEQSLDWVTAWMAAGRGGLFAVILRDIAAALASQEADMETRLAALRADWPGDLPELDEFLQAVRFNLDQRQSIVEQLRALGSSMRNQLNNGVDEAAQKASLQVTLITSGIVVPALLLIVGGVALLQAVQILQ